MLREFLLIFVTIAWICDRSCWDLAFKYLIMCAGFLSTLYWKCCFVTITSKMLQYCLILFSEWNSSFRFENAFLVLCVVSLNGDIQSNQRFWCSALLGQSQNMDYPSFVAIGLTNSLKCQITESLAKNIIIIYQLNISSSNFKKWLVTLDYNLFKSIRVVLKKNYIFFVESRHLKSIDTMNIIKTEKKNSLK